MPNYVTFSLGKAQVGNRSKIPETSGGRSHFFSLNLRASVVPAYYRDKFSFCKKKNIGLSFTDGNMWPSKISNGPRKNPKGAKHGPQNN